MRGSKGSPPTNKKGAQKQWSSMDCCDRAVIVADVTAAAKSESLIVGRSS